MTTLTIPWAPRLILTERVFRLPIQASQTHVTLEADGFEHIANRWSQRDNAHYFYLKTPKTPGDYTLSAQQNNQQTHITIQVRTLSQLRQPFEFNQAQWPRRWHPLAATG